MDLTRGCGARDTSGTVEDVSEVIDSIERTDEVVERGEMGGSLPPQEIICRGAIRRQW
jgi:hypothetical protein